MDKSLFLQTKKALQARFTNINAVKVIIIYIDISITRWISLEGWFEITLRTFTR